MKILHIVPGMDDVANGMVVVANLLAKEQTEAEVVDLSHEIHESGVDEVWVHGMWLPKEWLACWRALRAGKRLVRMTHGSLSPVYLKYQSPFKKWLVGPIERWCLRRCNKIVATCDAEKGWIEKYLGKKCPEIEVMDIKRFFKLVSGGVESVGVGEFGSGGVAKNSQLITHNSQLHLLYLGRRHPLKGVEYLEEAVRQLNSNHVNPVNSVQNSSARSTCPTYPKNSAPPPHSLRSAWSLPYGSRPPSRGGYASPRLCVKIISNAFGEELEKVWDWCDVLVLPTLSDNFGLVIAEALERGKCVITTDGAPAWQDGLSRVERVDRVEGELWSGYGGRLIYLKGYRDGTPTERVELLKHALSSLVSGLTSK